MPFDRMLGYCADLRDHNDRTWFHENHRRYEEAKKDFLALLDQLRYVIAEASPEIGGDILYMDARDWVYRIARDMRFYKNVPPYNPAFRAYISADRKSWLPIGYFLCVEPGATIFGTGLFLEETAERAAAGGRSRVKEAAESGQMAAQLRAFLFTRTKRRPVALVSLIEIG